MRTVFALLLALSIGLLGSGASEYAHVRVDSAHAEEHAGDHDQSTVTAADHADHSSGEPAPAQHRPQKHHCVVCLTLAAMGKTSQAPPLLAVFGLDHRLVSRVSMSVDPLVASQHFALATAPRGPPLV